MPGKIMDMAIASTFAGCRAFHRDYIIPRREEQGSQNEAGLAALVQAASPGSIDAVSRHFREALLNG
jgi:hypothetical protein